MKIFYISNARIPGDKAHSAQIMAMCDAFASEDCTVTLLVPTRRNTIVTDPFIYHVIPRTFTIEWVRSFDVTRWGACGFWLQSFTYSWSVVLYCIVHDADVIYTRDLFSAFALTFLKTHRVKVVWEVHKRCMNMFVARCIRYVAGMVVLTESIKKYFIDVGVPSAHILVAPDGVNLGLFDKNITQYEARMHLGLPVQAFIFCYTGRFKTMGFDKGLSDMFDEMRHLSHSNQPVLFLCVGAVGAEQGEYEQIIMEAGIDDRVRIVPRVSIDQLVWYQKAADALVMPFPNTVYYAHDISPLKMFEYMTSQRIIVAPALPSIGEVLDTTCAVLYNPIDPNGLGDALKYVMEESHEVHKRARFAYEKVQKYSWRCRASAIQPFLSTRVLLRYDAR